MSNDHPTYPNPIIQEAVCEIHFRLPDDVEWKPVLLGEFFKHIQNDFPELEPVTQIGVQIQVGSGGVGQLLRPPQELMRYKHASRNLQLQLSNNILTVNVLPEYEGWTKMSEDILYAWTAVQAVIKPAGITRIGLRYIDRIERTYSDEQPGEWLKSNIYIPESILSSLPSFLLRLETRIDSHNKLIVTLGDPPDEQGQRNAIILDIDCIIEREIGIDSDTIARETTELHKLVWTVFSSSMTPRLARRLKGNE